MIGSVTSGDAGAFLTADWRALAMLNFEVEPSVLAPHVPAGTTLDAFQGRTLVSVVGFRFLKTRVLGLPIPFHRDFDEVNLRFYVRRAAPEGPRRGVVFVKEIVPRRAIAWTARLVYGENYVRHAMRHDVRLPDRAGYSWRSGGRWNRLDVAIRGEPELPARGSEEEFVADHEWGYTRRRGRPTLEYRVEHAPWRVWRAVDARLDADVATIYGPAFVPFLTARPASAFVADGSPVLVRRGAPI